MKYTPTASQTVILIYNETDQITQNPHLPYKMFFESSNYSLKFGVWQPCFLQDLTSLFFGPWGRINWIKNWARDSSDCLSNTYWSSAGFSLLRKRSMNLDAAHRLYQSVCEAEFSISVRVWIFLFSVMFEVLFIREHQIQASVHWYLNLRPPSFTTKVALLCLSKSSPDRLCSGWRIHNIWIHPWHVKTEDRSGKGRLTTNSKKWVHVAEDSVKRALILINA